MIPNAENKDRTGAFWLRNLNLSFFFREKNRQSLWKREYSHFHNDCLFSGLKTKLYVWSRVLNAPVRCFPQRWVPIYFLFSLKKDNHYENESISSLVMSWHCSYQEYANMQRHIRTYDIHIRMYFTNRKTHIRTYTFVCTSLIGKRTLCGIDVIYDGSLF